MDRLELTEGTLPSFAEFERRFDAELGACGYYEVDDHPLIGTRAFDCVELYDELENRVAQWKRHKPYNWLHRSYDPSYWVIEVLEVFNIFWI